ncbi:MAG: LytR C-terminal domain-containing protein [Gaiellaceae bacterium]
MEIQAGHLDALRPWRTATLVAGTVAAVELVLLVVAGVALFGEPISRHLRGLKPAPAKVAGAKPAPAAAAGRKAKRRRAPVERLKLARGETSVLVLNGNGIAGSAGAAAERARDRGYLIGAVENAARRDHPRSIVMYRPGYRAEGRRLARDLGVRAVGPLDGLTPAELRSAHAALIVGR